MNGATEFECRTAGMALAAIIRPNSARAVQKDQQTADSGGCQRYALLHPVTRGEIKNGWADKWADTYGILA